MFKGGRRENRRKEKERSGREEYRKERKNHLFLDGMRENHGRTFRVPLIIRTLKDYILKVK